MGRVTARRRVSHLAADHSTERPETLVVEDRGRTERELAWRLEIWADGEARVRSGARANQRFSVEASALRELSSMLEHAELAWIFNCVARLGCSLG